MIEKPDILEGRILSCIQAEFEVSAVQLEFLPWGYDQDTAIYRATSENQISYFVKMRRGKLDLASVVLPRYLHDLGLKQVIPPFPAKTGKLWASMEPYNLSMYPFIEGQNGYAASLSSSHWIEFGRALKNFHALDVPRFLAPIIRSDQFSDRWRRLLETLLAQMASGIVNDPVAAETVALMQANRDLILELIHRADHFASQLAKRPVKLILCHGDIHAGNLLSGFDGALYLVDWDTLVFAPKERDLMFVGAGLGGQRFPPEEEEAYFYQGYGEAEINHAALAYYRYARIIEDIAIFCQQLVFSDEGGEDRRQSLNYLKSNFEPGGTIEIARRSDA